MKAKNRPLDGLVEQARATLEETGGRLSRVGGRRAPGARRGGRGRGGALAPPRARAEEEPGPVRPAGDAGAPAGHLEILS